MELWEEDVADFGVDVVSGMGGFEVDKAVRRRLNGDVVIALRDVEKDEASVWEACG